MKIFCYNMKMHKKILPKAVKLAVSFESGIRGDILRAAIATILNSDTQTTSLNAVAKVAGMSVQKLRYHYKSMDEILEDVLRCLIETGRTTTVNLILKYPPNSYDETILRMAEAIFLWIAEYPHLCRISSLMTAIAERSEVGRIYKTEVQSGFIRIQNALNLAYPHWSKPDLYRRTRSIHMILFASFDHLLRQGKGADIQDEQEQIMLILKEQLLLYKSL